MKLLKKIFEISKSKLWMKGLINGIPATVEFQNLLKDISVPETVIDIGSNRGQFILFIEKIFHNKRIYSFEPIAELIKKQKYFFSFKKNITFFNVALGSSSTYDEFLITNRTDSSSFLEIESKNNNSGYYKINEKRRIKINTLDNVLGDIKIKTPLLIKIDVQGFELEVLKGSKKLLKKTNYLLLEVSKNEMYKKQASEKEIINFMKKHKFKIYRSNKWSSINKTNFKQRDILFIKKR